MVLSIWVELVVFILYCLGGPLFSWIGHFLLHVHYVWLLNEMSGETVLDWWMVCILMRASGDACCLGSFNMYKHIYKTSLGKRAKW